jgi:hypothetical protein
MAMSGTIHVGDIGTVILGTIQENDEPIDISTATVKELIFLRPDGIVLTRTANFSTDGADGKIAYAMIAGDLTQSGTWQYTGHVVMPASEWTSSEGTFEVAPGLDASKDDALLSIGAGQTYEKTFVGLVPPVDWKSLYWTMKKKVGDADAFSIMQVRLSAESDDGDGLLILNAVSCATPEDASLEIDEENDSVNLVLTDNATVQLGRFGNLVYDVKAVLDDSSSRVLVSGLCATNQAVTRSIV